MSDGLTPSRGRQVPRLGDQEGGEGGGGGGGALERPDVCACF